MEKTFVMLGAGLMFLAVAAGAFGSHALGPYFDKNPDLGAIYDTAVRYHMIHALALLGVAWASTRWPGGLVNGSGWLLFAGILIFSGTLYALSLTGIRWLGAITPIGGVAFLSGWLCLLLAAWRG
ncbi:MAG: DUF423 domain-containing protein [Anaerolineales bacterium]|nr:DUF423 domain-containing protein [Anaerolineales bacterium]MCB8953545.1 DUF423 domain-containing protein [Ardenticatenales bacterium]